MSRIYIENLPKNINENELRKRFSQKGEITDIQLKKDKRTAFIGFKSPDHAEDATKYFDKTFIYSCKISVKPAQGFRVKNKLPDVNLFDGKSEKQSTKKFDPFEELKNDPDFESFLQVQRNIDLGKGKQIWKDDVLDNVRNDMNDEDSNENNKETKEDDQALEEIMKKSKTKETFAFTVKLKGLPYKIKKRELKDFLLPVKPLSLRFPKGIKGISYVSFKTESDLKQTLVKHRGFINGHRIEITSYQMKSLQQENANKQPKKQPSASTPKWKNAQPAAEPIGDSGRIYVRNLSYICTEDDLRQLFEKYGTLAEFHMPIDSFTKKPKGFAFITFVFPEQAVQAFNELDKTDFQGRLLHLLPAHAKSENYNGPPKAEDEGEEGEGPATDKKSSFKMTKQEEQKKEANNSLNWNTLFIRPNAVADIMTKKFEVNKLDLLTKSNKKDNVAVRMALGETQIVHEIRQFLLKNKVCLDSFSRSHDCPRSKTVILVKNLPADTEESEMSELFSQFGLVNRVILPPYGVTAIIEMQEPNEAKFAFKKLAYNNFKHHPLYLEWAPEDVFDANLIDVVDSEKKDQSENMTENVLPIVEPEELPEENTTIFVKNLNFNTTEDDFRNHFEKIGKIYSATIAVKKSSEGLLSMGYGFIQFCKTKHAKEAIKRLQNSELDSHQLEIKLSNRTINKPNEVNVASLKKTKGQKQTGSKICVKNIPFEATVRDIQKIFGVYGQIKSVRLPKKLAGASSFRGFGFVDFVTKDDAKRAFEVLSHSTHLYGRPLVLEWAKDDSSANELLDDNEVKRVGAKMARYFDSSDKGASSKRLKKSEFVDELQRSSGSAVGQMDDDFDGE